MFGGAEDVLTRNRRAKRVFSAPRLGVLGGKSLYYLTCDIDRLGLVVVGDAGGDDEDSAKEIQVKRMPPFGIASAVRHNVREFNEVSAKARHSPVNHWKFVLPVYYRAARTVLIYKSEQSAKDMEFSTVTGLKIPKCYSALSDSAEEQRGVGRPLLARQSGYKFRHPAWVSGRNGGAMRCAEELASHAAPPCVALDAYTTISSPMSLLQHFPGPYTVQLKQHQENRSPKSWLCHAEEKTLALFLQKPAWNFGVSQTHQNDESRVLRKIIGSNKRFLNAIEVTRFLENKRSNKVTKKATTPIAANAAHSKVNQFLDCSNAYPLFAVCRVPPGRSSLAADVVRLTGTAVRLVDGQIDLQRASLPPKASTPDDCLRRDRGSDHNSL
ncbi:hypothetical protein B0H14DRAFT_2650397 [Mycena olivaceomarginata]|nr:hypothetical protein B0H14DRAFT_2650397 [Mycena olivaceomarginata]